MVVQRLDPEAPAELGGLENCFDTVLCLNVLGYLNDPGVVVESLRATALTEGLAAGDVPTSCSSRPIRNPAAPR